MITRVSISGDTVSLTKVSKKDFFRAWLLLIQNDLRVKNGLNWEIDSNSAFHDLKDLVFTNGDPNQPEKFTDNANFQGDETVQGFPNDFELVEKLEIILQDRLGFTGYASLFTGLMTFSVREFGRFRSDFVIQNKGNLRKLRRDFNIWTHDTQYLDSREDRGLYYMSIKFDPILKSFIALSSPIESGRLLILFSVVDNNSKLVRFPILLGICSN